MTIQRATILLLLLIALVPTGGCAPGSRESARAAGPPILVLALDTLRGDHLGCGGRADIRTPHVDALAADGVYFRSCLSTFPWTGPAFASLYTGLLPHHHGYLGGAYSRLADEHETMAEILAARGYRTAAFVTIGWLTGAYGMDQGFEIGDKYTDGGRGEEAEIITRLGLEYARQHAGEPFFLFLHYFDAHAPYTPPAPFDRMYYEGDPYAPGEPLVDFLKSDRNQALNDGNQSEMYDWLDGVTDPAYPVRQYAAGVSYVDHQVGKVIAGLKELGLYDEMLIVLVSDHGEHLGEHGFHYTHAMPFLEVAHVPLIVKWPRGRHAGAVVGAPVSTLDVLPTLLEELGLPPRDDLDGRSLLPIVADPDAAVGRALIAEQGASPGKFCKTVLRWPWKLMLFSVNGEWLPPALFDLADDPGETRDVSADHPDAVAMLERELWRVLDRGRPLTAREPLPPRGVDEETRRRLRALGYVD
jgi:arylsulfatase A-like enzyme